MMQTEVPTAELFQFGGAKQHLSLRELADNLSMTDEKLVIMIPSPDINDLKAKTSLVSGEEEAFATHRAISRLAEMQHISWWPATLHTILRNG